MSLTLDGTTGISATGNIYGNNIIVTNSLTAGTFSPTSLSASGNVTGGNIVTGGAVSATGNVTGNYLLGNAALVTGLSASSISAGTSNVNVVSSGGNVTVGIGGTSNVSVFATTGQFVTGVMSSTGNGIHGNILTAGLISATSTITSAANVVGGNITTGGLVSATGNVIGNYLLGNAALVTGLSASSITSGTSNVNVVSSGGNVTVGIGGTSNVSVFATTGQFVTGVISSTGNITGGNLFTAGSISATGNIITGGDHSLTGNLVDSGAFWLNTSANGNITFNPNGTGVIIVNKDILNGQANGVGNIGNATGYFNTVFAKATSAQYADLAEMYVAGSHYEPGTVVVFGGSYEIEISTSSHANTVAGVISTNPSYIMNAGQTGPHVAAVALTGRVPTRVIGPVRKGDRMVSGNLPGVAQALDSSCYEPGCILGKALQEHTPVFDENGNEIVGIIEVVVGRI
jgi:hypothetical protein